MAANTVTVGIAGSSQPHNNMQPYLGLNYIIAIAGIFPSRN
jgi:microcystin-dependent protein